MDTSLGIQLCERRCKINECAINLLLYSLFLIINISKLLLYSIFENITPHVTPHDGLVNGLVIKIESNPVSKN
jgi:hypothetical protein